MSMVSAKAFALWLKTRFSDFEGLCSKDRILTY